MGYLLLSYPSCSTCKNAEKWLEKNKIEFEPRNIKEQPPTKEELAAWAERGEIPLTKFFNTSGVVYREMNIKERVKVMTQGEILDTLAMDGMLVKRPILVGDNKVLVGFKEEEWKKALVADIVLKLY